jgi:hypothetical protein
MAEVSKAKQPECESGFRVPTSSRECLKVRSPAFRRKFLAPFALITNFRLKAGLQT